uniref:Uncharacterized protein n=1 Tax=Macrostomum lignano TaxID=282301 RepID=A0A1I8J5H9_9PLAT
PYPPSSLDCIKGHLELLRWRLKVQELQTNNRGVRILASHSDRKTPTRKRPDCTSHFADKFRPDIPIGFRQPFFTGLEEASRNHIVRTTRLNPVACRPSPLERQKVSLVLDVFHEKTVAALQLNGYSETADFVERVLNFWTVVNVKSPESHIRLNDIRRAPISSTNSSAIQELLSFAAVVDRMPGGRGASRPRSLTTETRKAIHQTANGLADLSRHLLMKVSCRLTGLRGSFLFIGKATAGVIIYPLIKFWPVRGYAECNFTVNWS